MRLQTAFIHVRMTDFIIKGLMSITTIIIRRKQMISSIKQIDSFSWYFEEENVRFFLLVGNEKALLIDSGMRTRNAKELAAKLTDLPISLINTHADPDHIGSNHEFEFFYMSLSECTNYYNTQKRSGNVVPVFDGDILDLGDRPLKIIEIPGHTPGSIALLDINNKRIFTGDPVQDGRIFMFGPQREMHAYMHSLKKLLKYSDQFDKIYPSHGTCPVKPTLINELYDASLKILSGKAQGQQEERFEKKIIAYNMGCATFLCDLLNEE